MLFNVDRDEGNRINGYIVPETFTEIPEFDVWSGNQLVFSGQPNIMIEALVSAGRHQTGQCGFDLTEAIIPDLARLGDLRIVEKSSNLSIYCRPKPVQVNRKLLRFETSLYPAWRLDTFLAPQFQYFEMGLEKHGRETVTQLFLLSHYGSMLLSGRLQYKNYAMYTEGSFDCFCIMQDPFEELIERLLILSKLKQIGTHLLGPRDASRMEPAMAFAQELDFDDAKGLKKQLQDMPVDVAHLLADPFTRQFSTSTPDELPGKQAIATTLDILSGFVAVGTRDQPTAYYEALGALIGIDSDLAPRLEPFGKVREYASVVRSLRVVDHLIENDLAVYQTVSQTLEKLDTGELGLEG